MCGSLKSFGHLLLAVTLALAFTASVAGASQKGVAPVRSDPATVNLPANIVLPANITVTPAMAVLIDDRTGSLFALDIDSTSSNFGLFIVYDTTTGAYFLGHATSVIFGHDRNGIPFVKATTAGLDEEQSYFMSATIRYMGGRGWATLSCIEPFISMMIKDTHLGN